MLNDKVAVPSANTDGPPALATLSGPQTPETLYLAYQGHHSTSLWWMTSHDVSSTTGWSGEAQVPNATSAFGPSLAADDTGTVFLLWRGSGTDDTLYWSGREPDGTWTAPQVVPEGLSSCAPAAVAVGPAVHVAWKGAGNDAGIYTRHYAGGAWSARTPITGAATSASPAITVLGDGVMAAWRGAGNEQISTSVYDGTSWSPPEIVPGTGTSTSPALQGVPATSAQGSGADLRAYLMWKGAGSDTSLYYTTFSNGAWRPQQLAGGSSNQAPALALLQSTIVAVWKDLTGTTMWWAPLASKGPAARKWTYLLGVVEATGVVNNFAEFQGPPDANNPNGTNPDGFDLTVSPGWTGITGSAPASLHCETYPEGIAVEPPPTAIPGVNHIPGVNRFEPYEPWGTTPFTAKWPNTPGMPPEQPDTRPFQLIGPTGQSIDLKHGDLVRVRGRLLVENGHAQRNPWDATWLELHPFDYHNLQADISAGIGSSGYTTHSVLLIAPLFSHAYQAGRRTIVGPSPWDLYDEFDPYIGPGARMYTVRAELVDCRLWGPGPVPGPPQGVPAGTTVSYRETVMINTTGKSLDELRTVTADASGLLVSAAVEAPETVKGYDFDLAEFGDPANNRGVLLIRYEVYWPQKAGSLLFTQHHTDGHWLSPPVHAETTQEAGITGRPVAFAGTSDTPGESQFVVSLADGGLVHAISSTASFTTASNVKDQVGGAIGQVTAVGAASARPGLAQFMFAVADGRLLHTTRRSADRGWYPVGDVKGQIGDIGHVAAIAGCGDPAKPGVSEWALATEEGGVWHAVRFADGTWAHGDVEAEIGDIGHVIAVAAAGTPTGQGSVQFVFVTSDDHLWHTTRHTDSGVWEPRIDVKSQVGDFGTVVAAAAVSSQPGYSQFLFATSDGRLYHTTRKPDGSWFPAGVVMGQIGDIGQAGPITAAAAQPDIADFLIGAFDTTPDPGQGPT